MNANNGRQDGSAGPLTDSPLLDSSPQDNSSQRQGSGEQEEHTLRRKEEALMEAPARVEETLTERERERERERETFQPWLNAPPT